MPLTRRLLLAAAPLLAAPLLAPPARAQSRAPEIYVGHWSGLAADGHDPVAFFTEGRPVPGRRDITLEWRGATWRFASAENRERFRADPERHAPRYGGHCAWATAQGYRAPGLPQHWSIVDGRLYLNATAGVHRQWLADTPGFIARADRNWPGILAR